MLYISVINTFLNEYFLIFETLFKESIVNKGTNTIFVFVSFVLRFSFKNLFNQHF